MDREIPWAAARTAPAAPRDSTALWFGDESQWQSLCFRFRQPYDQKADVVGHQLGGQHFRRIDKQSR